MSEDQSAAAALTEPITNAGEGKAQIQGQPATSWIDSFDDDTKSYIGTKGWKDPAAIVESYRNIEKMQRTPQEKLLRLPDGDEDEEGWGQVYTKLGRPETKDGYEFPEMEAEEGKIDLTPQFREWAFEQGLSQKQAAGLFNSWNTHMEKVLEDIEENVVLKSNQAMEELKSEWGNEFQNRIDAGKRFATRFGLKGDQLDKLERAIGTKDLLKFAWDVGKALGEHKPPEPSVDQAGSFGMTPSEALDRINALKADDQFMAKYMAGDADAKIKYERLFQAAYPSG